jgi:hypothetical protein
LGLASGAVVGGLLAAGAGVVQQALVERAGEHDG